MSMKTNTFDLKKNDSWMGFVFKVDLTEYESRLFRLISTNVLRLGAFNEGRQKAI